MKVTPVLGQPSWQLRNGQVSLALTRLGGHLGPVKFRVSGRVVSPYAVAPWWNEQLPRSIPPILRVLRGDFFCMPFGGNASPFRGERHPVHGETANAPWSLVETGKSGDSVFIECELRTKVRPGRVRKRVELRRGQPAVFQRHVLSDFSGPMSLGHHAMLRFGPGTTPGALSFSRFCRGQVCPFPFEDPVIGGYSTLKTGAEFSQLDEVPAADGGSADLTTYPARPGFEDLAMISSPPGDDFAWSAITLPDQAAVWISLKDPRCLASTILWHSNGGRHYPPWSGRHRGVIGIEEVTSFFHAGLAESARPNAVSRAGIKTCVRLNARQPFSVASIQLVAALPQGFGSLVEVGREPGALQLVGSGGKAVRVRCDWHYLYEA